MTIKYKDKEATIEKDFTLESLTEACNKLSFYEDEPLYEKRYTMVTSPGEDTRLQSIINGLIKQQMKSMEILDHKPHVNTEKMKFTSAYIPSIGSITINREAEN